MKLRLALPALASAASPADASPQVTTVLSHSGQFETSAEERKLLCLLSDGRLLVAAGQDMNVHVLSYQARLQRMQKPFRVEHAKIDELRQLYASGGALAERRQEHSMMQVTAKDLLSRACTARASDIHIRVRQRATEILFRVRGDLTPVGGQTREYGERLLATLYGAMASVSDSSYKPTERQDASIADRDKLPPELHGVRIATVPTSEGTLMVLRLLYVEAGDSELCPLGFSEAQAEMLQQMKEQPIGMNIIGGPTGSGKSTTLQRVLSGQIAEAEGRRHVLTIEDPVEYPIDGAVQTAVTNAGSEDERSRMFAAAIANAMRLDPDTIMVGEVRDRASAQNAVRAAMTGHQVWTTVHANSALAIADRLLDLGLSPGQVTDHTVVTGLISQRLVKALCPHCKVPLAEASAPLPPAVMGRLREVVADLRRVFVTGLGCEDCNGHGTIGRTVVAEVIMPDEQFFSYIRRGEKSAAQNYWLRNLGGRTMLEHAIEKVSAGLVDPRMAEQVLGHLNAGAALARRHLHVVEEGCDAR
ncbi:GspE/PulE family protein [Massilia sp. NR 4-1]|uniref:GspE/PulE family protein n=1 Tax=Massilia sp. NR 4-1 TaxID=1678028 RepID=UPI00067BC872|nr:ATPase, T2SS/T4P/T4SS family [Massilia sp. NR 4-1]